MERKLGGDTTSVDTRNWKSKFEVKRSKVKVTWIENVNIVLRISW